MRLYTLFISLCLILSSGTATSYPVYMSGSVIKNIAGKAVQITNSPAMGTVGSPSLIKTGNPNTIGLQIQATTDTGSTPPANLTFDAEWPTSSIDASFGGGLLTGTPTGSPAVLSGELNLTGATAKWVDYAGAGNADSAQTGTIRTRYRPGYTGAPAASRAIFSVCDAAGSTNDCLLLTHGGTGQLILFGANFNASQFINNVSMCAYSPTSGTQDEIELDYDFTGGATRLFVNGTQCGSTQTNIYTRTSASISLLRVGGYFNGTVNADAKFDNFVVYSTVQHTANYTSPIAALGLVSTPQVSHLMEWLSTGGGVLSYINNIGEAIFSNITSTGKFNSSAITAPASPISGDSWNDTTQKTRSVYEAGITQNLLGTIFTGTASATVANTTTETSIDDTGIGTKTLPANFFAIGKTIEIKLNGYYSTHVAVADTLRLKIKLGSTIILDTTAKTPTAGISNGTFTLFGTITSRTIGGSGTVFGQGHFLHVEAVGTGAVLDWDMTNTATTTIDTTASQAITATATWGGANTDSTITTTNMSVNVSN